MNQRTRRTYRRTRSGVGTGTTSLLMIFTVLCFATLALLSLSTAASNQRIQKRSFEGTAALAVAEGQAAEKLAELDTELSAAASRESWNALATGLEWQKNADGYYESAVPIDESHQLVTVVELLPEGPGNYRVISQMSVFTGEWTPTQDGDIWSGN